MTINQRIKQLRQSLGLSQARFAQAISISNGYIAGIELENRKTNDRIIKLICSAYGVSEIWLRAGEGSMFIQVPNEKLNMVINLFNQLNPEFQNYVLQQLEKLFELQPKPNTYLENM